MGSGMIVPLMASDPERLGALFIADYCTTIGVRHEKLFKTVYRNGGRDLSSQAFNELSRCLDDLFAELEACRDEKTDPSRRPTPPWMTAKQASEVKIWRRSANIFCQAVFGRSDRNLLSPIHTDRRVRQRGAESGQGDVLSSCTEHPSYHGNVPE